MAKNCIEKSKNQELIDKYEEYRDQGMSEYHAQIETLKDFHKDLFDAVNEIRGGLAAKGVRKHKPVEYQRFSPAKPEPQAEVPVAPENAPQGQQTPAINEWPDFATAKIKEAKAAGERVDMAQLRKDYLAQFGAEDLAMAAGPADQQLALPEQTKESESAIPGPYPEGQPKPVDFFDLADVQDLGDLAMATEGGSKLSPLAQSMAARRGESKATPEEIAQHFGVDPSEIEAVSPLADKGDFGWLKYSMAQELLDPADSRPLASAIRVFLDNDPMAHEWARTGDYKQKQAVMGAIMDRIAQQQGKDRSSQMTAEDWDEAIITNFDDIPDTLKKIMIMAAADTADWHKNAIDFADDPELRAAVEAVEAAGITTYAELAKSGEEGQLRKEILRIGDKYGKQSRGENGLSADIAKRVFDRILSGDFPSDAVRRSAERAGPVTRGRKSTEEDGELARAADSGDATERGESDDLSELHTATDAWHGTGAVFAPELDSPLGKFRDDKILTGEGANAFGRGHYATEKEKIAIEYRNNNTRGQSKVTFRGQDFDELERSYRTTRYIKDPSPEQLEQAAAWVIADAMAQGADFMEAVTWHEESTKQLIQTQQRLLDQAIQSKTDMVRFYRDELRYETDLLGEMQKLTADQFKVDRAGAVYKVKLLPDDQEYLLYDVPFSGQSEHIQNAIRDIQKDVNKDLEKLADLRDEHISPETLETGWTPWDEKMAIASDQTVTIGDFMAGRSLGGQFYWSLDTALNAGRRAEGKFATPKLLAYGVKGNKYLDGGSRNKGKGTFNYVMFDPKDIRIEEIHRNAERARAIHESLGGLSTSNLAKQIEAKIDRGALAVSPKGNEILRRAWEWAADKSMDAFGAAYFRMPQVNMLRMALQQMKLEELHKGDAIAAKAIQKLVDTMDQAVDPEHRDLVLLTDYGKDFTALQESQRAEEFAHRGDHRSRQSQDLDRSSFESIEAYNQASTKLSQGFYQNVKPTTLHNEVIAKIFRPDALENLGIDEAGRQEIQDTYLDQLLDNDIEPEAILEAFEGVESEYAEAFKEATRNVTEAGSALSPVSPADAGRTSESGSLAASTEGAPGTKAPGTRSPQELEELAFAPPKEHETEEDYIKTQTEQNLRQLEAYLDNFANSQGGFLSMDMIYDGKRDVPFPDAVVNLVRTGYLAGLSVVKTNLFSNTLNLISEQLMLPFAAGIDIIRSKMSTELPKRTTPGLSPLDIFAGLKNIPKGLGSDPEKGMIGALKYGVPRTEAEKYELGGNPNDLPSSSEPKNNFERQFGIPLLDGLMEGVKRVAIGIDRPFKAYAEASRERGLHRMFAMNQAAQKRLEGDVDAHWRKIMKAGTANPFEEISEIAKYYGRVVTFQNANPVTDMLDQFKRDAVARAKETERPMYGYVADGAYIALGMAVPFMRTPVNVGIRALEWTPLGAFSAIWKLQRIGTGYDRLIWFKEAKAARNKIEKAFNAKTKAATKKFNENSRQLKAELQDEIALIRRNYKATPDKMSELIEKKRDAYDARDAKRQEGKRAYEADREKELNAKKKEWQGEDNRADHRFDMFEASQFAEAGGRTIMGSFIIGLVVLGVMNGLIEAVGATDYGDEPDKANAKREAGIPDNSVKIGSQRIPFDPVPLGRSVGMGLGVMEQMSRRGTGVEKAEAVSWRLGRDLMNTNPLTQQEFQRKTWSSWIGANVAATMPILNMKLLSEIADIKDDKPRKYFDEGFFPQFQIRIPGPLPGSRETLPVSQHPMGGQRPQFGERVARYFDPTRSVTERRSQRSLPMIPIGKKTK